MDFTEIEKTTLIATILVAVIGWIFALWLQSRNIKRQHQVDIRYDIYKQLVQLHKDVQDTLGRLSAISHPPFISMESSMIPFNLKLQKVHKDFRIE